MKNKKIILIIGIFIITLIFTCYYSKKLSNQKEEPIVTYAMTLTDTYGNSTKITEFPTKDNYFVDVNCAGANGSWDYNEWKLIVKEIVGNISCKIDFKKLEEKQKFSDKLISLSDSTQGDGKLVHETIPEIDYSEIDKVLDSSDYLNVIQKENNTTITNIFEFSDDEWHSKSGNMQDRKTYELSFKISTEGYYQFCINMPAKYTSNFILYINDQMIHDFQNTYYRKVGCINVGRITTSDAIKVTQYGYASGSYGGLVDIDFSLKKIVEKPKEYDSGYRFEGKNPNNYVLFNDELWRIIGVFDENSHGIEEKNLVKIMKAEPIGTYLYSRYSAGSFWDMGGPNTLNYLLNYHYLNNLDATGTDYCLNQSSVQASSWVCDFRGRGMKPEYHSYIENATWFSGGITSSGTSGYFYQNERINFDSAKGTINPKSYIGLIYPSDYGFSVLATDCNRSTNLGNYNNENCVGKSWMSSYTTIVTLTDDDTSDVWVVSNRGNPLLSEGPLTRYEVVPTLYLKDLVYVVGGDGSLINPYIITMD